MDDDQVKAIRESMSDDEIAFLRAVLKFNDCELPVTPESVARHLGMSLARVHEIGEKLLALGLVKLVMPTIH